MSKTIKLSISQALSVKMSSVTDEHSKVVHGSLEFQEDSVHGSAEIREASVHGSAAISEDSVHGAAPVTTGVHGAMEIEEAHLLSVHGSFSIHLPEAQKVSRVEIRKEANGELTIVLHE